MSLIKKRLSALFFSAFIISGFGCSQPVLEPADCLSARDRIRKLYSMHIDGGANPAGDKLDRLRPFISDSIAKSISEAEKDSEDVLTLQRDFPKAFRAGACFQKERSNPVFDILLIWRNSERNMEKKILVTMVKKKDWVVSNVRKEDDDGR